MMEFTKYGRAYVPEKRVNYAEIKNEKYIRVSSDLIIGVLLFVVMILCPFVGLFI